MPSENIAIEICAPQGDPLTFSATEIILPGEAGVFTVLPGHTPFLTTLAPGVVIVYDGETISGHYAVSGGFAEVRGDKVKILADLFEVGEKIDPERAKAAQKRAEKRLKSPKREVNLQRAEMALHRAIARIGANSKEGY